MARRPFVLLKSMPPVPLAALVLVLLGGLLAGCGEDTTRLAIDAVGRTAAAEPDQPVTELAATDEGLIECDEAEPVMVPTGGEAIGPTGLDQQVMATLADYGRSVPNSFAGLWLDARYGGAPVVAFSDRLDEHRRSILAELGRTDGAVPFVVAQARYSTRQLESAALEIRDVAVDSGVTVVRSGTVDEPKNRVVLELLDATEADLDRLTRILELEKFCVILSTSPPIPEGPLDILPREGQDKLLSCGDFPFPESALTNAVPLATVDHPTAKMVAEYTAAQIDDWIVLDIAADRASYGKYDGEMQATVSVERQDSSGGAWEIKGWTFGCELRVGLPIGLGAVELFLDPTNRPEPTDRTFIVLASELACSDGQPMGRRLLGPQVMEFEDRILLASAAVMPLDEAGACPDNPTTAVRVELDAPLGGRTIMNGMFLPPRPLSSR